MKATDNKRQFSWNLAKPEGLYLGLTPDEEPAIFDAQDVCHMTFTDGGNGDPVEWQAALIQNTCRALGVAIAYDGDGEPWSVEAFIERYNGYAFAKTYTITEHVEYEVEAMSPSEAMEKFLSDGPDDFCTGIRDRHMYDSKGTEVTW